MLAGCMQASPSADEMTRPAIEAFTRLGSWRPWQPAPQPAAAPQLASASTTPVAIRPDAAPPAAATAAPATAAPPSRFAVSAPSLRVEGKAEVKRERRTVPPDPLKALPASLACQTLPQPGQRVRMECAPQN